MNEKLTVKEAIAIARRAEACPDALDTLTSLGTWDAILAHPDAPNWLDRFAANLPTPLLPAYEEYNRARAAAFEEYKRVEAPAFDRYDRAGAAASAASATYNEYKRAASAAYSEYERAALAAYEEYKRVRAAAFRVFAEQARPYLDVSQQTKDQ